jgi:hypothetical protein
MSRIKGENQRNIKKYMRGSSLKGLGLMLDGLEGRVYTHR